MDFTMLSFKQQTMPWYNFVTKQYDNIVGTPANLRDYIPQTTAALGYFDCSVALGKTPRQAALEVLEKLAPATGGGECG